MHRINYAGEEAWFWQYSPYAYFNEHGIAVSCKHTPMKLEEGTIEKLFDFVEVFPHYFIGNNAPLPRVGGSILMHDHFQGGGVILPMQKADIRATLTSELHPSVRAGIVDWHNTAFRLEGENRYEIAVLAMELIEAWQTYARRKIRTGIVHDKTDTRSLTGGNGEKNSDDKNRYGELSRA